MVVFFQLATHCLLVASFLCHYQHLLLFLVLYGAFDHYYDQSLFLLTILGSQPFLLRLHIYHLAFEISQHCYCLHLNETHIGSKKTRRQHPNKRQPIFLQFFFKTISDLSEPVNHLCRASTLLKRGWCFHWFANLGDNLFVVSSRRRQHFIHIQLPL